MRKETGKQLGDLREGFEYWWNRDGWTIIIIIIVIVMIAAISVAGR